MKMSLIWPRDCEGYRIGGRWRTVVGLSDRTRAYDALAIDGLYRRLADMLATDAGVLAFARTYGLLTDGLDTVDDFLNARKVVRWLIARREKGDWPEIVRWFHKNHKAIRLTAAPDYHAPPELFFKPMALIDAIYLQFFMDISSGAQLRLCKRPGCGNWFKYGPGTGHRETAEYCSPKCQKAHAYSKTKESKQ
jgi:hypothetical protein